MSTGESSRTDEEAADAAGGAEPERDGDTAGPRDADLPGDLRGADLLERPVVVLHRPRDLVNVALVIRAMKNVGLRRLRLVAPREEFDPTRVEGIAHGTGDLIRATEIHDTLEDALADAAHVAGTSARRRSERRQWKTPEEVAPELLRRTGRETVALVFGPENRGLTNEELDLCHQVLCIPTSPDHPSLNLSHAALLLFWELRRAADEMVGVEARNLEPQPRHRAPPATTGELEDFFEVWERALHEIGLFYGVDPVPKMRTYRSVFQRADLDRRELELMEATAYEILHYARRERARIRQEVEGERPEGEGEGAAEEG